MGGYINIFYKGDICIPSTVNPLLLIVDGVSKTRPPSFEMNLNSQKKIFGKIGGN